MTSGFVGIDFGTTNSLVSFMDGDRPTIIPNARGDRSTPSVVALSSRGEVLVGESAKNQAFLNPDNTVVGIKRLLGASETVRMGGKDYRPAEIAALLLAALRADAERHLGRSVDRAVVTAPANFSEPARRALREAGRLAGLRIERILNEPTAAALSRAWLGVEEGKTASSSDEGRLLLVYDFGGGTFDVTILRQRGRDCAVLASCGDGRLGGMDLDQELVAKAKAYFAAHFGLDVDSDRLLAQQLADQAERAKIELSELSETTIALPFAFRSGDGGLVHPQLSVSRAEFEAIAAPFVERTLELTARALADAKIEASKIDRLILSGGSSRMPLVRRILAERFGLKPEGAVNPEEVVAMGAAVESALISGSDRLQVRDVVSRTYGVEIDGGRFVPLIRKNSPVPASKQRMFTTVSDDQDSVEVHVLQGESARVADNLSLGRFLLAGLRPARAGAPRIQVDFTIDESDILHVSARDLETGIEQAIRIVDLQRGVSDESAASIAAKIQELSERLAVLASQAPLGGALGSEISDAVARGRAAAESDGEGRLRVFRAELEGLVGELLARGVRLAKGAGK
ncbi:MAG TPA: Hsp70 family protein [Rectinemataceae bacterium]|nr:Hsp70 family protein [Rectinemataceae bacterium]